MSEESEKPLSTSVSSSPSSSPSGEIISSSASISTTILPSSLVLATSSTSTILPSSSSVSSPISSFPVSSVSSPSSSSPVSSSSSLSPALNNIPAVALLTQPNGSSKNRGVFYTSRLSLEKVQTEWLEFDLDGRRTTLDEQAQAITEQQDQSATSRAKLEAKLTAFTSLSKASERRAKLPGLLGAYQKEILRLSERAGLAEGAFLLLYQALANLTDPLPALNTAVSWIGQKSALVAAEKKAAKLEEEVSQLREAAELAESQAHTIRELEQQLHRYQTAAEDVIAQRVRAVEDRLQEQQQQVILRGQKEVDEAHLKVQQKEDELLQLQGLYQTSQSQLFEIRSRHAEETARSQSEVDRLSEELSAALSKISALQSQLQNLDTEKESHKRIASLEEVVATKDRLILSLTANLSASQTESNQLQETASQKIRDVQLQLSAEQQLVQSLRDELAQAPSVSQLNQLLERIKVLESLTGSEHHLDQSNSTEDLFRQKILQLENRAATLNAKLLAAESELEKKREQSAELEKRSTEQEQLIAQLEDSLQLVKVGGGEEVLSNGSPPSRGEDSSSSGSSSTSGGGEVMQIVCRQRDRFKSRIGVLEAQIKALEDATSLNRAEREQLRAENQRLSSQIRSLESYRQTSKKSSHKLPLIGGGGDVENQAYSSPKFAELNIAEKFAFYTGRLMTANKFTRTFVFVYTVALHLLVYSLISHWTS